MTLKEAVEAHKYGDLRSWKDLFFYQNYMRGKDLKQVKEIAEFAKRHNQGDKILLPLKDNPKFLLHEILSGNKEKTTLDLAEEIFI